MESSIGEFVKGKNLKSRVMIVAGEASGDLHGSGLVGELKRISPDIEIFGIGGPRMEAEGVKLHYRSEDMAFMGLVEVMRHIPFVLRALSDMRRLLQDKKPDLLILIDYAGFNLKLANIARKKGIPVLYYILPKVWAWGGWRIPKIVQVTSKIAAVFPFEPAIFNGRGGGAEFVGHPLLEVVKCESTKAQFLYDIGASTRSGSTIIIGVLPGSRRHEIERIFPIMLEALKSIGENLQNIRALVGCLDEIEPSLYEDIAAKEEVQVKLLKGRTYDLMRHSDLLLVGSGTATLEAAILGTPMVIIYSMSYLSYIVAKLFVKIPHVGLPNIIAGKEIVPEFIQRAADSQRIASESISILKDSKRYEKVRRDLSEVKDKLGGPGASVLTAEMAADMIGVKSSREGAVLLTDSKRSQD